MFPTQMFASQHQTAVQTARRELGEVKRILFFILAYPTNPSVKQCVAIVFMKSFD